MHGSAPVTNTLHRMLRPPRTTHARSSIHNDHNSYIDSNSSTRSNHSSRYTYTEGASGSSTTMCSTGLLWSGCSSSPMNFSMVEFCTPVKQHST